MEQVLVDEAEKKRREARAQRFGEVDKGYLKQISFKKGKMMTPDDIQPTNPKESYKLMLSEQPAFDMKKIMMYGVNLMNTSDIEAYFNRYDFKVKKIFWLNDFSCIVEFDNDQKTLEAFWKMTNRTYDTSLTDIQNYDWKTAEKQTLFNHEMDIELRIAEIGDQSKKSDRKESVYFRFYNRDHVYNHNNYNYKSKKRRQERSRDKDLKDKDEIMKEQKSDDSDDDAYKE